MKKEDQVKLFDKQAKRYAKRNSQHSFDKTLREQLFQHISGDILEVSVGTGTNFPYYHQADSITAVDFSERMLEYAKQAAEENDLPVELHLGDVEQMDFPRKQFDCVVSTLSLCSYPNPEHVLSQLSKWCKEEGSILLLEHGMSSNALYRWLQNRVNAFVKKRGGCHMNRDIIGLVEAAPMTIDDAEHRKLGTVHLLWCTPNHK